MVHYLGFDYMTAEHAYQASKFAIEHSDVKIKVSDAVSAYDAKRIAHENKKFVREDWCEELKLEVMEAIVRAKAEQHEYIQCKLLAIEDGIEIVEDSPTDDFWGRGPYYNGQNHLGKIWMKVHTDVCAVREIEEANADSSFC